jgi:hypothetical protein
VFPITVSRSANTTSHRRRVETGSVLRTLSLLENFKYSILWLGQHRHRCRNTEAVVILACDATNTFRNKPAVVYSLPLVLLTK